MPILESQIDRNSDEFTQNRERMLAAIAGQIDPASGELTPVDPARIAWAAQRPLLLPRFLNPGSGRPIHLQAGC